MNKSFRLLGLTDEQRLDIEQASNGTIKTEAAQVIVDAAVRNTEAQVKELLDTSLREIQSIIGPHGSITRLQAGGVRISPGLGISIFEDGILKTTMKPSGDLAVGSNIEDPATTTFYCFVNDQVYNNESMEAGDLLIGDNTSSASNVKFDASEGQLQFRYGSSVQAYVDTDGTLRAGAGAVTLDTNGVSLHQGTLVTDTQSQIKWVDDNAAVGSYIIGYDDGTNRLHIESELTAGKSSHVGVAVDSPAGKLSDIRLIAYKDGVHHARLLVYDDTPSTGTGDIYLEVRDSSLTTSYMHMNASTATIFVERLAFRFNASKNDHDFDIFGTGATILLKADAGLDAIGIGDVAESGYKLKVTGNAKVTGSLVVGSSSTTAVRELLTADRTYYVRTDGSDSNTGLANTSGGAFLTVQKAVDIATSLDTSIYNVTIQLADGTYAEDVTGKNTVGAGTITIQGNSGTPANVVIGSLTKTTAGTAYVIKDLKFTKQTAISAIKAQYGAKVNFSNVNFGASFTYHVESTFGGNIIADGNYTVSGGAAAHTSARAGGGITIQNRTVTVSGTPAFSTAFAECRYASVFFANGNTYSGSATGSRYLVDLNAVCQTVGGGANYFPGNAAGTTATGGQYA
jgi:hypothetical protein